MPVIRPVRPVSPIAPCAPAAPREPHCTMGNVFHSARSSTTRTTTTDAEPVTARAHLAGVLQFPSAQFVLLGCSCTTASVYSPVERACTLTTTPAITVTPLVAPVWALSPLTVCSVSNLRRSWSLSITQSNMESALRGVPATAIWRTTSAESVIRHVFSAVVHIQITAAPAPPSPL